MIRAFIASLAAVGAVGVLVPMLGTPVIAATGVRELTSDPAPGYYRIRNFGSDKYLAIGASSTENGAHAIQWEYTGSEGQLWYINADRKIINANSRKCLAIGNGTTENGAHAIQWDCLNSNSQRWEISEDGYIRNVGTGKYLSIGASSTENGAHAIQWAHTGSPGQHWV
ncbi:RICIN domain-containing protein [Nonomuraea sp. LPB2021202275-12-8]|uniref:RICIN domain-containing protein n=1 Tax=Nonomuraea sp. LPB2021202275-12-8 TaxID=3120159 RepID=UPI00300CB8F3